MKKIEMIYMDGYDEVRDLETQETIFSTKVPKEIEEYFDRDIIVPKVIDNVVIIWNKTGSFVEVDEYLLDEGDCSQEERELIVESMYAYIHKDTLPNS